MATDVHNIKDVFQAQKKFFSAGTTRTFSYRKEQLTKLKKAIKNFESELLEALGQDLGKPEFEAYGSEIGFVYNEIDHSLKCLRDWMDPERVPTSIVHFPTTSKVLSVPKGQVLILAPWNYPFMLVMSPLQAAISAGNTAVIKLPNGAPHTSKVIDRLLSTTFPEEYICCINIEDPDIIPNLIHGLHFDHIFFTGSTRVGKLIMAAAAEQLIPVTLELGGKSPAIVDNTADLKVAAKRIIWGKGYNAGQTCVAPDHVFVHHEVKVQMLRLLQIEADDSMIAYGGLAGFSRLVNLKHFERMLSLLKDQKKKIHGGDLDADQLRLGLCIIDEPGMESQLMKEEIFGPLLPVISYQDEEDLREKLNQNPDPLSIYLFTSDKKFEQRLTQEIPFGGGCINNCLIHLSNPNVPFGGIGTSGMGNYHGKNGFDTFSHRKSILKTRTWLDLPMRYAPYEKWKMKILRLIFN